ncbi:MAG: hypothetical protein WKG07_02570 [Hymenobacter sp.]
MRPTKPSAQALPLPPQQHQRGGGGTGTFAYQWEASADNSSWNAIASATNPTFAPGALTATTYFRRRVTSGTGSCATDVSNVVTVLVQPVVTPTVTLAAPPVLVPRHGPHLHGRGDECEGRAHFPVVCK